LKIGIGYDIHRLVDGGPLIIGGTVIPSDKTLLGYSDGDVVSHAIIDALLGAAALGDMGTHFPSGDPLYKGANSLSLLSHTGSLLCEHGWQVVNLDATIIAEYPTMFPHVMAMRYNIANAIQIPMESVSVKSTTADGLGFVGKGDGIAAQAVVLVEAI
jgi:2-C-methyl-D-erythritol 2,4-cyclodiphosphate synthase